MFFFGIRRNTTLVICKQNLTHKNIPVFSLVSGLWLFPGPLLVVLTARQVMLQFQYLMTWGFPPCWAHEECPLVCSCCSFVLGLLSFKLFLDSQMLKGPSCSWLFFKLTSSVSSSSCGSDTFERVHGPTYSRVLWVKSLTVVTWFIHSTHFYSSLLLEKSVFLLCLRLHSCCPHCTADLSHRILVLLLSIAVSRDTYQYFVWWLLWLRENMDSQHYPFVKQWFNSEQSNGRAP